MNSKRLEGYSMVYKNEDGSLSCGQFIHRTPHCAVASINIFEGREVLGFGKIDITPVDTGDKKMCGMEFKLHFDKLLHMENLQAVADLREKWLELEDQFKTLSFGEPLIPREEIVEPTTAVTAETEVTEPATVE